MSLLVKEQSSYTPPPEGTHIARCFGVVDLGTQVSPQFGPKLQVVLMWELPHERVEYEDNGARKERPATISKYYTATLSPRGTLRKHLDAWRGRAFTEEDLKGWDLTKILGASCVVSIQHRDKPTGGKAGDVTAVAAVPKGTSVPELWNKKITFNIEDGKDSENFRALPEWLQKKVSACLEWNGEMSPAAPPAQHEPEPDMEDVPF